MSEPRKLSITASGIYAIERMALNPGWAPPGMAPMADERRAHFRGIMATKYGWERICPTCLRGASTGREFLHEDGCRTVETVALP